jgi:4-carboxymuconolactone decarboxylase
MESDHDAEARARHGREIWKSVMGFDLPPTDVPFLQIGVQGALAEVWNRPGLTRKERRLITMTCVGVLGNTEAISSHVRAGLESGDLTPGELDEFVFHFAYYAGFPLASSFNRLAGPIKAEVARARGGS